MTNILVSDTAPSEGVHCAQQGVELYQDSSLIDSGSIYITESYVVWQGAAHSFNIPYLKISLHAVSKDLSSFPREHLLLMMDEFSLGPSAVQAPLVNGVNNSETDTSEEEDVDDAQSPTILRIVPANQDALPVMYKAMSDCQALNPDPDAEGDSDFEGDDEDDEYYNGNDEVNGDHEVGPAGDDEPMDEDQFANN